MSESQAKETGNGKNRFEGSLERMKNLGFGMMRLPVLSGPTDFDYEQLNRMVDAFLEAGYTYFDISYVYH